MMRILGLVVGAVMMMLLVAVGFANAGIEQAGTTAANFLSLGSGARVLGMGGATLGLGDDLGSGAWNPGALGYMNHTELVFSHSSLGDGTQQEWAAVGGRLRGGATRWSLSGLYHGQGSFEGRDASNLPTGTFNASSFAFGLHLAHRFGDVLSVGAGTKIVSENLGTVSGFGATFDFGASAHQGPFGFGVAAQNVGGQMKYDGAAFRFPGNIGAGVSYAMPLTGLRLALDANFPTAYYNDVRFGAEYLWHEVIAIRAGYRHEMSSGGDDPLTGPTFGLGAGWNGMWMDYGYLVSSTGEAQHRLGFRLFPHRVSGGSSASFGQTDQPSIAPPPPAPRKSVAPEKPASKPSASVTPPTDAKSAPAVAAAPKVTDTKATETKAAAPPAKSAPANAKTGTVETKALAPAKPAATAAKAVTPAPTATKAVTPVPKPVAAQAPKGGAVTGAAAAQAPKGAATKTAQAPKTNDAPNTNDAAKTNDAPKTNDAAKAADAPKPATPVAAPAPAPAPPSTPPAASAPEKSAPEKSAPQGPRPSKIKVQSKDTLASIGRKWNVSVAALMMENNLTNEQIQAGQTLKLPAAGR